MEINQRILITGANSFLGTSLTNDTNNNKYLAYVRQDRKSSDRVHFENNIENLLRTVNNQNIRTCIHMANFANTGSGELNTNSEITFLKKVKNSGIQKVIYISTYWVDIEEYSDSQYVIHKKRIEETIKKYFSYKILRIGDVYGVEDQRKKLIPFLLDNENSEEILLNGFPENIVRPLTVKEACIFINNTLEREENYNNIIDFYGEAISLEHLVNKFKEARNKSFKTKYKKQTMNKYTYLSSSDETHIAKSNLYNELSNL